MYHYMAALHQRFFQVPDFTELEEEIEQTRQEVRDCLGQPERRKLMQLVDRKTCCGRRSLWPALSPDSSWPRKLQKSWR